MLATESLPQCSFCYREEALGKKSKRMIENERHDDLLRELDKKTVNPPVYLDLRLGNKCNLKCRTCNPLFSSAWSDEVKNHPENSAIQSYASQVTTVSSYKDWYSNPKTWESVSDYCDDLREVYLTGGEPMLIKEHELFLKQMVASYKSQNIHLRYNTNLTVLPDYATQYFPHFKKVTLSCSIDGIQERNEWLRHPSRWTAIEENLKRACLLPKNVIVEVNCAISAYNILHFADLVVFFANFSKAQNRKIEVSADLVHEPEVMNLKVLPTDLQINAAVLLEKLLRDEELNLTKHEKREIKSLILLLQDRLADRCELWPKLVEHTREIDHVRGQRIASLFPELGL